MLKRSEFLLSTVAMLATIGLMTSPAMATCNAIPGSGGPYTFGIVSPNYPSPPTEAQAEAYFVESTCQQYGGTCEVNPLHYNGSQGMSFTFSGALCGKEPSNPVVVQKSPVEAAQIVSSPARQSAVCASVGWSAVDHLVSANTTASNVITVTLQCK